MRKQVIYAAPNFADLRRDNGYFVDKTPYIAKLERINNPVFLRPRRFGKSFLCSILHYYYDLRHKDLFDELFGDTWIGQNPTGQQSQYMVLHLNFSSLASGPTIADIQKSFRKKVNRTIKLLRVQYAPILDELPPVDMDEPAADNLSDLIMHIEAYNWPRLFVIIDEYDNFANQLIKGHKEHLYDALTDDDSFFKNFFKVLKEGRETGAIKNNYITGILPMTIDDLASAFNVGTFLTLNPEFEAMVGFTQEEVDALLDDIFDDYAFPAHLRHEIGDVLKTNYDGYHFLTPVHHEPEEDESEDNGAGDDESGDDETGANEYSVSLYNTTILMYFLWYWTKYRKFPEQLTDNNLKTDMGWFRRLAMQHPAIAAKYINQLATDKTIAYNNALLGSQFNIKQFFDEQFFPIAFFHLGILTRQDAFNFTFPNLNMYQLFVEYFNEYHKIDMTNPFSAAMRSFSHRPNLEALFRCYWEEYVQRLPEPIFMQVNENFYRTTFYQLCTQHLSTWFTWHVERPYANGKSDLEFVGKFNEKFAGLRWITEFKYYSKAKMQEKNINIADFEALDEDIDQLRGYARDLEREVEEIEVRQFLIYCFGNEGFQLFEIE
ncbi:MAG: AAA family ATPase [Chloroflexota bacterium]